MNINCENGKHLSSQEGTFHFPARFKLTPPHDVAEIVNHSALGVNLDRFVVSREWFIRRNYRWTMSSRNHPRLRPGAAVTNHSKRSPTPAAWRMVVLGIDQPKVTKGPRVPRKYTPKIFISREIAFIFNLELRLISVYPSGAINFSIYL